MTRPLSIDLRKAIINAYNTGLGTVNEIAKVFSTSSRSVFRYLKQQRDKGDLTPDTSPGRPPILTAENLAIIKKIVLSNSDETLEQYQSRFYKETGINVTIVTIFNACNKLDLRRKKKSFFAAEQERKDVQIKRADFIAAMEDINPSDIIVLDESGADLSMTSEYARAEGGKRANSPKPHIPGSKFSIIGAIGITCIIAAMYIQTSVNAEIFRTFVEQLLNPKLGPGKYVIMDNVGFHKNDAIVTLIESTGAKVVFLPPYSPDLSPIEKMWSKIKEFLKRIKPRSNAEFHNALTVALHEINEDDLSNWYEECGYNVCV